MTVLHYECLVARRLEVSRPVLLSADCGLARLIYQAAQVHLGGPHEFRITDLHEHGEENIKRSIRPRSSQDAIRDWNHLGGSWLILLIGVLEQAVEGMGNV